ncbi:MAG: lysozyme [Janthinobacterium lividum]
MFTSTAKFSDAGELALRCEEGEKTHTYCDTRGIQTIGVGHTHNAPSHVPFFTGSIWTQAMIDAVFRADLAPIITAANRDLTAPVSQCQFDALISLEYNIGMGGLRSSHVVNVINHHGVDAVTETDFLAWAHPSQLKGRREREWAMFSRGVYRTA